MNVTLYQAAAALDVSTRWQESIAQNLASSPVNGYKKQDVSFMATSAGARPGVTPSPLGGAQQLAIPAARITTNFTPGEMRFTGEKAHLAIDGKAFFEVQLPDGEVAYTRDGEFHFNRDGELVNKQGHPVIGEGGPITIDLTRGEPMSVSASGEISQGVETKGRIKLVGFSEEWRLESIGGGLYSADDPALTPTAPSRVTVRQGWLEGTNASVTEEMVQLLSAMRTFEANQRVIQLNDERMGKSISEIGNS